MEPFVEALGGRESLHQCGNMRVLIFAMVYEPIVVILQLVVVCLNFRLSILKIDHFFSFLFELLLQFVGIIHNSLLKVAKTEPGRT